MKVLETFAAIGSSGTTKPIQIQVLGFACMVVSDDLELTFHLREPDHLNNAILLSRRDVSEELRCAINKALQDNLHDDENDDWGAGESEYNLKLASTSPDSKMRRLAALTGYNLDAALTDKAQSVRMAALTHLINAQSYGTKRFGRPLYNEDLLSNLVHDESVEVRRLLAVYGKAEHLDKLVYDKSEVVRLVVAKIGAPQYLDVLVNDEDKLVRYWTARLGNQEHLEQLCHDPEWSVRAQVAERGAMTHELINDECYKVRMIVADKAPFYELVHLNAAKDTDIRVRQILASRGIGLDNLGCDLLVASMSAYIVRLKAIQYPATSTSFLQPRNPQIILPKTRLK